MTGVEVALLGSTLASSTAGASAVGLLGAGGVFAPAAGSLFSGISALGTLGTVASLGSSFFGMQSSNAQAAAAQTEARTNAAIDETNAARKITAAKRESYLRAGSQKASAAALGRSTSGNVLDIMADSLSQEEAAILGIKATNDINQAQYSSSIKSSKSSNKIQNYSGILSGVNKLITA